MPNRSKQFLGLALLIVGLALCGFGLSLLLKPDQYAATARIKVQTEPDVINNTGPDYSYDPYFIQTTFEIMQSQLVLGIVITNLNLNEVWGQKYFGGKTLKTTETLVLIKNRMNLAPVRNTKLVDITFYSDDPNEAAQVANAIAKAYGDYRINSLIELRQLLGGKLDAKKLDQPIPNSSLVQITDFAEPPKSPVGPNHFLGMALLALGLISTAAGFFLLKQD